MCKPLTDEEFEIPVQFQNDEHFEQYQELRKKLLAERPDISNEEALTIVGQQMLDADRAKLEAATPEEQARFYECLEEIQSGIDGAILKLYLALSDPQAAVKCKQSGRQDKLKETLNWLVPWYENYIKKAAKTNELDFDW